MSGFCPATELLVDFGVVGKAISNPRSGDRKAGHCGASCTAGVSVFVSWANAPVAMMAPAAKSAATIVVPRIGICRPSLPFPDSTILPERRGRFTPAATLRLRRSLHHPLIHGLGVLLQRLAQIGTEIEHVASGIGLHLDGRRAGSEGNWPTRKEDAR